MGRINKKRENNKAEIIETSQNEPVLNDSAILDPQYDFKQRLQLSLRIARQFSQIIKQNHLSVNISGKEYVRIEAWELLGLQLAINPILEEIKQINIKKDDSVLFGYEATYRLEQNGVILSRASAIAVQNSKQKEMHAVYSMAQTRAIGKAYRIKFAWLMTLAGYEGTPAEEIE